MVHFFRYGKIKSMNRLLEQARAILSYKTPEVEPQELFPPIAALIILRKIRGKGPCILLSQTLHGSSKGLYLPPGGYAEEAEQPMQTALREAGEEGGLQVTPNDLIFPGGRIYMRVFEGNDYHRFYPFFTVWNERMGVPRNLEPGGHSRWEWIPIKDRLEWSDKGLIQPPISGLMNHLNYHILGGDINW